MKSTAKFSASTNGANTSTNGATLNSNGKPATFTITPAEPVSVAEMIEQAKAELAEKKAEKAANADHHAPEPAAKPATPPTPEPAAKPYPTRQEPEPAQPETVVFPAPVFVAVPTPEPARSRAEEVEYQIDKAARMQQVNSHLQSLKAKMRELNAFAFSVDGDDEHRYGRVIIYDDQNRDFTSKNSGLAAIVVDQLKTLFAQKIEEKENELLTVAQS